MGMIARCKVLASRAITPSVHDLRIAKPRGFEFRPVQFCGLEIETEEGGIEYPMSLACSPTRPYLEFGARVASQSPWKRAFQALQPGDEVEIDGPYGHFVLDEQRPAVFVAGGIGITPLKGMIEYATDKGLGIPLALAYSNRSPEEIAYKDELDDLARKNPKLKLLHTVTRPPPGTWQGRTGRIDEALLREAAQGMRDPTYYLCGLPEMVSDLGHTLQAMGVPRARIAFEQFWGYEG
jgi:ferredoxin-NADP reductase